MASKATDTALSDTEAGTESPRPEDSVARVAAELTALLQSSNDAIIGKTVGGVITGWNAAAEELYGYRAEEIIGRHVSVLIPLDRARDLEWVQDSLVAGQCIRRFETVRLRRDGTRVDVSLNITPIWSAARQVVGAITVTRDITDQIQTQAALSQALRERDNIIETIPDVLYRLDLDGRVRHWNQRLEIASGLTHDEVRGRPAIEFFAEEDRALVAEAIGNVLTNGFGTVEARMLHRDGSFTPYHYTGVPLRDESGKMIGLTGIGRDITDRMHAQEQTSALLEIATTIGGTLDLNELFERVQRETAQRLPCDAVLIFKADEVAGTSRIVAHHGLPSNVQERLDAIEFPLGEPFGGRLGRGETVTSDDLRRQPWVPDLFRVEIPAIAMIATPLRVRGRRLGALAVFNTRSDAPFLSHQINLVRGIGQQLAVAIEATELYQAQQEEAAVSAALARVGQETIALLDTPALLGRLCELTTELLQCDYSHTWLWKPDQSAFALASAHGDPPEHLEVLRTLRLTKPLLEPLLAPLEANDLVQLPLAVNASPLSRLPRQLGGIGAIVILALRRGRDVVGLHTAGYRDGNRQFSSSQERIARGIAQLGSLALQSARLVGELERVNRLKSDFVATMSHELRTPLNIILGYNDLVLEGEFGSLNPEQAEALQRVDGSARTLLELINATLDMSRLESGRLAVEVGDVDIHGLLRQLDSEVRDLYEEKLKVQFVWRPAGNLPRLHTDGMKLKVVLKNLISNAIKFTDRGTIAVEVDKRNDGVAFRVSDSGIGIDAEMQSVIFEPFRQLDSSTTRRYGGVGLGLHIVKRLVELLGGQVALESEIGVGSTFTVWVPLIHP